MEAIIIGYCDDLPIGMGKVIVIGGGVSGMRAALDLAGLGVETVLVERGSTLGGLLGGVNRIFPSMEPSSEIVGPMVREVESSEFIEVLLGEGVESLDRGRDSIMARLSSGRELSGDGVIFATGLVPFDATEIPEFGLGRFPEVVTSLQLEGLLRESVNGKLLRERRAESVVFIQCVGSRVERRGHPYCSAVCCGGAIKNALLIKELDPEVEVSVLYIDIRTHGKGWEDLYREGRKKKIRFIRGQPSLVSRKPGVEGVMVSGENTLLKELYRIRADLVVLQVGLGISPDTREMLSSLGISMRGDGLPSDQLPDGVFLAGTVESPKEMAACLDQAGACAARAAGYLRLMDDGR